MKHTHILPDHATDGCLACGRGIREPVPIHEHTTTRHCSECRGDINEDGHHCAPAPELMPGGDSMAQATGLVRDLGLAIAGLSGEEREKQEHAAMIARAKAQYRALDRIRARFKAQRRARIVHLAVAALAVLVLAALSVVAVRNVMALNHSPLTVAPAGE